MSRSTRDSIYMKLVYPMLEVELANRVVMILETIRMLMQGADKRDSHAIMSVPGIRHQYP